MWTELFGLGMFTVAVWAGGPAGGEAGNAKKERICP